MALSDRELQEILRIVRGAIDQNRPLSNLIDDLTKKYGQAGELVGLIAQIFSDQVDPGTMRQMADTLAGAGFRISPDEQRVQTFPSSRRRAALEAVNEWEAPGFLKQADILSSMIETPQSSNVYAYGYDPQTQILYVQFKAGESPKVWYERQNSCSGETYWCGIRPHVPGPIYAYGSRARPVPESVFNAMMMADSKGEFVWQYLRVCGSHHEHRYPYTLVSPDTNHQGANNLYVPRKAWKGGYRTRTVAAPGRGKRPFERSTLRPSRIRKIGRG